LNRKYKALIILNIHVAKPGEATNNRFLDIAKGNKRNLIGIIILKKKLGIYYFNHPCSDVVQMGKRALMVQGVIWQQRNTKYHH
jgi:hypothetical protein